ncbi:MAG: Fic family protein [Flavobacteriales bacterium]|nr:Fic family protein [Flavobacteriales bacterium]
MSEKDYKINPDRNLPWNGLPDLPISESFYRNVEVLEQLGEAKAALARLHGRSAVIPNQAMLVNTISLQEAKASSEIENIFTTDDELYKAYSDQSDRIQGGSKEVLRYREALWSGYEYLQKAKGRFDVAYFEHVGKVVKQVGEGIRPDFAHTVIKRGGSGAAAGKVVYTPPKGRKVIDEKLNALVDFLNDEEKYPLDPLLKMAMAHFQFEAIHPFRDGNGRTGRVFNIHYLTSRGLLDVPILFLSRYILQHKDAYYSGLSGVSQRGDWQTWLMFMLRAVENTANHTFDKINDIVSSRDAVLKFVQRDKRNFRDPERLVTMLYNQPYIKVKHLVEAGLYAENTARDYLNRLCELQVLEKKELEGYHYYLNVELYGILSE